MRASRAQQKFNNAEFSKIGVSHGQPKMLQYIVDNSCVRQKDIAAAVGIEPSSATSILTVMERNGLIKRTRSADDKRRHAVCVTELGQRKLIEINRVFEKLGAVCFEGFTEAEIDVFTKLLQRVTDNMCKASLCDSLMDEKSK